MELDILQEKHSKLTAELKTAQATLDRRSVKATLKITHWLLGLLRRAQIKAESKDFIANNKFEFDQLVSGERFDYVLESIIEKDHAQKLIKPKDDLLFKDQHDSYMYFELQRLHNRFR